MEADGGRHLLPVDSDITPAARRDEPSVDRAGRPLDFGIEGVELVRLAPHVDHRGALTEVFDPGQAFWRDPLVYSYAVTIRPGRIKGWGMHKLQADRYFIAAGCVRVVLYDGRTNSSTYERYAEFHFTETSPGLLRIPPGVWHADQNWGERDVVIMNFPTRPYDHANPDKYRIDPHSGEIPFDWALRDG